MKLYPILLDRAFERKYAEGPDRAVYSAPGELDIPDFDVKFEYTYYDGTQTEFVFAVAIGNYGEFQSIRFEDFPWFKHIVEGKSRLYIHFPYEGFGIEEYNYYMYEVFNKLLFYYNIPPKNIRFLSGNIKAKEDIKRVFPELEDYVFGVDYFASCFMLEYLKKNKILSKTEVLDFLNTPKEKEFIFKNAAARSHRVFLASYFKSKGILDKTIFTFLDSYSNTNSYDTKSSFDYNISQYSYDNNERDLLYNAWSEFESGIPYTIDMHPSSTAQFNRQSQFPIDITHKSFFTFSSETLINRLNDHTFFITEKAYQNFAYYHPFILLGCPGTYEHLHKLGFETFPEIFNEDFDLEPNMYKRVRMILDQVEKFLGSDNRDYFYSQELAEKLVHNRTVLEKLDRTQSYIDTLKLCLKLDS